MPTDKTWIGLMVSRTLPYDDKKAISNELKLIFGKDILKYEIVCNEQMSTSGEYFIFVKCLNYWSHISDLNRCHYVSGVIPKKDDPYKFSDKEINDFYVSADRKEYPKIDFVNGDVVLIKDGYLKGLYGVVVKQLSSKKYKIFFSFYVRQFFEIFVVTSLEKIGKVSGYEFSEDMIDKPVVIGANVVHYSQLHRKES